MIPEEPNCGKGAHVNLNTAMRIVQEWLRPILLAGVNPHCSDVNIIVEAISTGIVAHMRLPRLFSSSVAAELLDQAGFNPPQLDQDPESRQQNASKALYLFQLCVLSASPINVMQQMLNPFQEYGAVNLWLAAGSLLNADFQAPCTEHWKYVWLHVFFYSVFPPRTDAMCEKLLQEAIDSGVEIPVTRVFFEHSVAECTLLGQALSYGRMSIAKVLIRLGAKVQHLTEYELAQIDHDVFDQAAEFQVSYKRNPASLMQQCKKFIRLYLSRQHPRHNVISSVFLLDGHLTRQMMSFLMNDIDLSKQIEGLFRTLGRGDLAPDRLEEYKKMCAQAENCI